MKKSILFVLFVLVGWYSISAQQNISFDNPQAKLSPIVNQDNSVSFRLYAPNAQVVTLRGDWMAPEIKADLMKGDDGWWTYTSQPLQSDMYIYTYDVDGTQIIDPLSVFQVRDVNSLFTLFYIDGENGDYYQVQDVPHGSVNHRWYKSDVLDADRRMTIYTPPGYENSSKDYPVLYLLHGSGGDEDAWSTLGVAPRILDNLIAQGKAQEMIVVMPNGNPSKQAAPGETSENLAYIPAMSHTMPGYNNGKYEESFAEIVNFVDNNYRTKPQKESRAIAGLSMGGFHSLYISANMPNTFNYVGLFSPATRVRGSEGNDVEVYQDMDRKLSNQNKNGYELYWIGCGTDDFLYGEIEEFRNKMTSLNIPYEYIETDRGHIWSNWRNYLIEFTQQLFHE